MPNQSKIEKHTVTLPSLQGQKRQRPLAVRIYVLGQPRTIFFAGLGNEGQTSLRILKLLQQQGLTDLAVVSPLPYWGVKPTDTNLQTMGIEGTVAAAGYLREHYGLDAIHAVAESQAAAALIYAATKHPDVFDGNIALLRPLGLVHMRRRDFIARMVQGAVQREQFLDWRTYAVGRHAAWRALQDLLHKGEQLNFGLFWDIRDELSKLARQRPGAVRIFAGVDDRLYPVESIRLALEGFGLTSILSTVPGGHASPAIRAGSAQVREVIEWCRANTYA